VAIARLPPGSFRTRLMVDGQRYSSTLPTEADARLWEVGTRAPAVVRRSAASVTFGSYATGWHAGFINETPDRARFAAALAHRLLPAVGDQLLVEVLDADRDELARRLVDAGAEEDEVARECLHLILADTADDLRAGVSRWPCTVWRQPRPSMSRPAVTWWVVLRPPAGHRWPFTHDARPSASRSGVGRWVLEARWDVAVGVQHA
jgi:hypothetical protein